MKIIQDTREQSPLGFNGMDNVDGIIVRKLDVGDYCCEFNNGYVPPVIFERKSIGDLFGTLTNTKKVKNYDRFKREIMRAKKLNIRLILIVEGSLTKVLKGYKYSTRKGKEIVKQMFTLLYRYNILPVFVNNREEMARYITEEYNAIGRKAVDDLKKKRKTSCIFY